MKLIIAGSRHLDITEADIDLALIQFQLVPTMIISGGCPTGADVAAKKYAQSNKVEYKEFIAQWDKYGKAAGPIRNHAMSFEGDALLLIWDGKSRGSDNMRQQMKVMKKEIFEIIK